MTSRKHIFTFLMLLLTCSSVEAQGFRSSIDSLVNVAESSHDSLKTKLYNEVVWRLRTSTPEAALYYADQADKYSAKCKDKHEICKTYGYMGVCYRNMGDFQKAIEYYNLDLKYAEKYGFKDQIAHAYNSLGNIYVILKNFAAAKMYLHRTSSLAEELADSNIIAYAHLNLGRMYKAQKNYDSAFYHLNIGMDIRRKTYPSMVLSVAEEIATNYMDIGMVDSAQSTFASCLRMANGYDYMTLSSIHNSLAKIFLAKNNIDSALFHANSSLDLYKMTNNKSYKATTMGIFGDIYNKLGRYRKATEYYNLERYYYDSIFNQSLTLQTIHDLRARMLNDNDLKVAILQQNSRHTFVQAVSLDVILLACLIIACALFFLFRKEKRQAALIGTQTNQIQESIQYARKIQMAILPAKENYGRCFSDRFVIYRPRDVISGDFYWEYNDDKCEIIAVADCTGHGVPGAFLSMLGSSFLQEIANEKVRDAGVFLEKMREKVKSIMHQNNDDCNSRMDGMDMALIIVDKESLLMQYAGAFIPLYYVRDGQLFTLKATRNPVAVYLHELPFKTETIQLKKDDCIYMSSDGYTSQVRGSERVKLVPKVYRQLLLDISSKSMKDQKDTLVEFFDQWKGDAEQVDDVLVVGFRV